MNPFDIKSLLLAKHAQHVVLVHFPIALFIVGVGFDIMAQWKKQSSLLAANYYNLLVAAVSTIPVMVTGIIAWRWQLEGASLRGSLLLHLILGTSSSLLIWMVWWIHYQSRRKPDRDLPMYRFLVEFIGVLVVALTGHLGGFVSGVNG